MLAHVPKSAQSLVAAFARTSFTQPDGPSAGHVLGGVAEHVRTRCPKAAEILLAAEDDVLADTGVPREHWSKVQSTNRLERLNREIAGGPTSLASFPTVVRCFAWPEACSPSSTTNG